MRSAQARLRSAQANLAKLRSGARPQERLQAQAQVTSAKANLDTQTKQLERIRNLVQQGALAGSQLDTQQATYESARTTYENAVQNLALVREGNRSEDIAAAQEQVRSAQEDVNTARANRELDASYADQVANAQAQVQAAKAQIQSAQAAVAQARENLADATVRAPFSGKVSGRPVQAGTVVGPGTAIVRLVGTQGVYFEGDVPSELVNQIRSGQSVAISVDAIPGRTFPGSVRTVGALGSTVGRLFSARIAFLGAPAEVRPGMFARGSIVLRTIPNAIVLPSTAVLKDESGSNYVMVAEGSKARKQKVGVGFVQGIETQVTGLSTTTSVIVQGQNNLVDGAKIKVVALGAKP
ncbi:efflux RND transporter periplasmic adaptor subunit [bacterium]|nr:MAG: efflux RND transporter periplasmic adaptor subunit [bacterium]